MKLSSVSGVLLAYHEEDVIENSIRNLQNILGQITDKHEVIIVGYEGCKDRTNEIVKQISLKDTRIKLVIQSTKEKGYGRAFSLGIKAATCDWIFQTDADGQYEIKDLLKLAALVDDKVDVIHGYRQKRNDPIERIIMAFCYNLALRLLFWLPIRDVDSAFKLIRRSAIKDIFLKSLSGFSVAELIIRLQRAKATFKQIPITHLPRLAGEALSEKGIKNPFNLQIPNMNLISGTLGEMFLFRIHLKKELQEQNLSLNKA